MNILTLRAFVDEASSIQKEAVSLSWINSGIARGAARMNPANPQSMKRLARVRGKMSRMGTQASDASKMAPDARNATRLAERAKTLRAASDEVPGTAREFVGGASHKKMLSSNPDSRINMAEAMHPSPVLPRYPAKGPHGGKHPLANQVRPQSRMIQKQHSDLIHPSPANNFGKDVTFR